MISQFPHFKKLDLNHKNDIEQIVGLHVPYSDFNFTSMWSYNVEGDMQVSILNNNLVVLFRDYITNDPFYSFIGTEKLDLTIKELFLQAKKISITPHLKLIPEVVVNNLPKKNFDFEVKEDRDNFDYVVNIEDLSSLEGKMNADKRREINKLMRNHPGLSIELLDLTSNKTHKEIEEVFISWQISKNKKWSDVEHELIAIKRLLNDLKQYKITCVGVKKNKKLIAFSISEEVPRGYVMGHFMKADGSYDGIFRYLQKITADHFLTKGSKYLNCEQDLGIPGLRKAKLLWRPTHHLKKYIISPKVKVA
jgi:hypothetical protein